MLSIIVAVADPYCRSDENVINYLNSKNIPVYGEPNGCGFITYNSRP